MLKREQGFTLIELMIVVVVIGILAAIAIPNFIAMQMRAREGSTKANMHTVQLAAEDYSIQNDGNYAKTATEVLDLVPSYAGGITNPFDHSTGVTSAWVDQATWTLPMATGSTKAGVIAYGDSADKQMQYQVAGRGKNNDLPLVLSSGSQ